MLRVRGVVGTARRRGLTGLRRKPGKESGAVGRRKARGRADGGKGVVGAKITNAERVATPAGRGRRTRIRVTQRKVAQERTIGGGRRTEQSRRENVAGLVSRESVAKNKEGSFEQFEKKDEVIQDGGTFLSISFQDNLTWLVI